jgi:hypothetical protein
MASIALSNSSTGPSLARYAAAPAPEHLYDELPLGMQSKGRSLWARPLEKERNKIEFRLPRIGTAALEGLEERLAKTTRIAYRRACEKLRPDHRLWPVKSLRRGTN